MDNYLVLLLRVFPYIVDYFTAVDQTSASDISALYNLNFTTFKGSLEVYPYYGEKSEPLNLQIFSNLT